MQHRVIGLNGRKGSGKDTAGAYLVEKYGYTRLSFAGPLKESAAALFDLPASVWEKLKNDPQAFVSLNHVNGDVYADITVREFLQRYGTEAHRDVFGQNFWIDNVIVEIENESTLPFVVTDVRFENEAQAIRKAGGVIVEITRSFADDDDTHVSEVALRTGFVDYTLPNDGSFDDLYRRLDLLVEP